MAIEIFKPNENPFGISYEDHIKSFWKFTCNLSKDKNPAINNNGQKDEIANQNSNSPVFYLLLQDLLRVPILPMFHKYWVPIP